MAKKSKAKVKSTTRAILDYDFSPGETTVGRQQFMGTDVVSLEGLPPSTRFLDKWAFRDCLNLSSLRGLPINVGLPHHTAFHNCPLLEEKVKSLGFGATLGPPWLLGAPMGLVHEPGVDWGREVGQGHIDAWLLARSVRFSLLACIKIARAQEEQTMTEKQRCTPLLRGIASLPDDVIRGVLVPYVGYFNCYEEEERDGGCSIQ
ncbi:hypothetical protein TeGR_g6013 [Tetraparma gracilis]|uniref:Uncharacterized protein n=1 Tax=Tetraparma gracilis TaxID=2962635 RepID=A0ABQ6MSD4_9STRA|nr:hypothetical protein TeGR_g6013 [Tetraparma gracilis]